MIRPRHHMRAQTPNQAAPRAGQARDLRLDFCRGLAFVMMFLDHVQGNVVARLTLLNFGFCDAAEVFVLLAGICSALAYAGQAGSLGRIYARAATIYVVHIGLIFVSAAIVQAVWLATGNAVIGQHELIGLAGDIPAAARGVALFDIQPEQLDILPLYVCLLLVLPAILAIAKRSTTLVLMLSAAVWLLANAYEINLHNREGVWYFHPLAWQLVFTIGIVIGLRMGTKNTAPPASRALLIAALAYLAFAFALAAPWTHIPVPALKNFHIISADAFGPVSKSNLSLWRLADVLCLAYVAAWWTRPSARWLCSFWARPLIAIGRRPLVSFAVASIASLAGSIVLNVYGRGVLPHVFSNGIGLVGLLAVAWAPSRVTASQRDKGEVGFVTRFALPRGDGRASRDLVARRA